jgi:hypothetical protein
LERKRHSIRDQALPATLAALLVLAAIAIVWSTGWPHGADTWGHISKAEYLAQQMQTQGLAAFFQTAWLPSWYMGFQFLVYYPPLATLILGPLIYLLGSADLAFKVLVTFYFLIFSPVVFIYLSRSWGGWAAFLGTALAVGAAYQMRTIFAEGNYPRMLALLALPFLALLTDRLLVNRRQRALTIFLLALCWAWTIVAHPQQALIFAVGLGFYLIFRLVFDPTVPLYRIGYWLAALFFGATMAAPWLLPAYCRAELSNVPDQPLEMISLYSAHISGFLPGFDPTNGQALFGVGAIVLAVLAIAARPDPKRVSWFLAGLVTILLSLGPQGVFFSLLPLNTLLIPERFLNFSAFAIPIAAAGILPIGRSNRIWRIALVVGLLTLDLLPGVSLIPGQPYPADKSIIASAAGTSGGRVALLIYPEPTSLEVYFSAQNADSIFGWSLDNTPHNLALRRVLSAPNWGPEYLDALFTKWDVRSVVVAGGKDADAARKVLPSMGFAMQSSSGGYELWRSEAPSTRVQVIPTDGMLVVGDKLQPFLATFPFAEETSTNDFLGSQSDRILDYSVLGMYQFGQSDAQIQKMESYLQNYIQGGGTVVIDLSGMEDAFGRTLDFLGVHVSRMSFADRIPLIWSVPSAQLPSSIPLVGEDNPWSGAVYDGLDVTVASVSNGESQFPILGYRQIGRGKVWFIGANLLYYAQLHPESHLATLIRKKVLDGVSVDTDVRLEPVPTQNFTESATGITFSYHLDNAANALVSYTYTPRWEALVDGTPIPMSSRDNLIRIPLPAGDHNVEIRYLPFGTVWPILGLFIGICGLAGCLVLLVAERRWVTTDRRRRSLAEFFKIPDSTPSGTTFSPCANCGFRLAESSSPSQATYPFRVSRCPICGARMDDESFEPGQTLEPEERSRILLQWLHANGYDPRTVYTTWGFSVDEFFHE